MQDCVWLYICSCNNIDKCKDCSSFLDVQSVGGQDIIRTYTSEVNAAIKPINQRWKKIFNDFITMDNYV